MTGIGLMTHVAGAERSRSTGGADPARPMLAQRLAQEGFRAGGRGLSWKLSPCLLATPITEAVMAKGRRVVLAAPLLLVGFLAKPAEAQLPLFVAAGPTFTSLSGDGVPDDFGTKTGFFVSVGTAIPIGDGPLAIRPFVGFTKRGGSGEVDEDEHLDLGYIDVPVFVGAGFPIGRGTELNVGAGPRISFQVSCQLEDGD